MSSDASMTIAFLQTYQPDDWIALFLKSYASGRIGQRVLPVRLATTGRIQEWLHRENESGMNLYVSLNAVAPQQTSRHRAAIRTIRHVFVDVDHRGEHVLEAISRRHDLPRPSYVLHTSPQRVHVLWRVTKFLPDTSEALQRHLARELHADTAATSCAQLMRLPGFLYLKPPVVRTSGIDLISPALTYGAVTDRMKRTETGGPTGLLILSSRQFVSLCCSGVSGRRDASCERLITVAAGVACD